MTYDLDIPPRKLLTRGNPKTVKGEKDGILTAILHLAPHKLSGFNVCAYATPGCAAACLNTAGRGGIGLDSDGYNTIQIARIRRTKFFRSHRAEFMAQLKREINAFIRYAKLHGFTPAIRLNGTSDLPWERIKFDGYRNVFEAYPTIQFYDYTKIPVSKRDLTIPNYHLTFSLAESNRIDAIDALNAGVNVAAVIRVRRTGTLPSPLNFGGRYRAVIDGDATDARFTDTGGKIIGLRAKGRAKHDRTGFVIDP